MINTWQFSISQNIPIGMFVCLCLWWRYRDLILVRSMFIIPSSRITPSTSSDESSSASVSNGEGEMIVSLYPFFNFLSINYTVRLNCTGKGTQMQCERQTK